MRRAFSLVEVLLAILILALGLLGLGAVIPVVVKQQRTASDLTLGTTAAKDAEAALLSRPGFSTTSLVGDNGWEALLDEQSWSRAGNGSTNHLWQPWRPSGDISLDLTDGRLRLNNETVDPSSYTQLVVADRLWPGRSMQTVERQGVGEDRYRPQFVWDFVGRRLQTAANQPRSVQVALFVRRIDANIRVPRTGPTRFPPTLLDVLVGTNISAQDRCVPVAVVSPTNPTPTNRGNNGPGQLTYANFLTLDATFDANYRDRIELSQGGLSSTGSGELLLSLAAQPNQKLVDNFGNVYTVLRLDEDRSSATVSTVVVFPPIPPSVSDSPTNATDEFRQVVFTPQIPGAVRVFTVARPVK